MQKQVTASCAVKAPLQTHVSWFTKGGKKDTKDTKTQKTSFRTQNTVSNLTLNVAEWLKLGSLVCKAKHQCFPEVEKSAIEADIQTNPVVTIRRPLTLPSSISGDVLECLVNGFSSGEICVSLQANSVKISEIRCSELSAFGDGWYLSAYFTIPAEHQRRYKSFTCIAWRSFTKQSTSKPTGKIFDDPTVKLVVIEGKDDSGAEPQRLMCSGTGFNPQLKWLSDSRETLKPDKPLEVAMMEDGRVKVHSEILVPQQDWSKGLKYTCEISDRNIVKTASQSVCAVIGRSSLKADVSVQSRSHSSDKRVLLICSVTSHSIKLLVSQWKVNGAKHNLLVHSDSVTHPNGSYTTQTVLEVPVSDWDSFKVFTCEVKHLCSSGTQKQTISKTRDPKEPRVRILRPSDSDLSGPHKAPLLCFISAFFPADISLHWELDGTRLDVTEFTNSPVVADAGGAFSMHSALKLPASQGENATYSCVVSHESSTNVFVATLQNLYGSLVHSAPSVELLQGSNELVCLAFGFSPSSIEISWQQEMTELMDHNVTSLAKGSDGKFSVRSHLPLDWAPGETYTCKVTHVTGTLLVNISIKAEIFGEALYINENKGDDAQDSTEEAWKMACAFLGLFLVSLLYGCTVTLVQLKLE